MSLILVDLDYCQYGILFDGISCYVFCLLFLNILIQIYAKQEEKLCP